MHAIVQTQTEPAAPSLPARDLQRSASRLRNFPLSPASPVARAVVSALHLPHIGLRTLRSKAAPTRSVDLGHVDGRLASQHLTTDLDSGRGVTHPVPDCVRGWP